MDRIATARDYRDVARRRLPHFLFEYYDGAAFDGVTAAANEADLLQVELRQHVLRDVSGITTDTVVLGEAMALPLALSPVGLAGMAARRGEVQAAKAVRSRGIPMALSTTSVCRLDEVAAVSPPWFQLYMVRDRGFVSAMMEQAAASGCDKLVLTVDLPALGTRWRDRRSGLYELGIGGAVRRGAQMISRPRWLADVGLCGRPHNLGTIARHLGRDNRALADCMAFVNANMEAKLDPSTLAWVRERWHGKLIVKGVMEVESAQLALDGGADALVVSNHGGRQLDGVASTARAMPRIAQALDRRATLLVDGGIRTGLDVLRMIALGADAVMIGRPWVYALAAGGATGVEKLIDTMAAELRIAMALTGCRSLADITSDAVRSDA